MHVFSQAEAAAAADTVTTEFAIKALSDERARTVQEAAEPAETAADVPVVEAEAVMVLGQTMMQIMKPVAVAKAAQT